MKNTLSSAFLPKIKKLKLPISSQMMPGRCCPSRDTLLLPPASRGIYDHFYQIATTVDIPLIVYNIPQLTGVLLPWLLVEDLAYVDKIVAIKDSNGDLKYMLAILEKVRHRIKVLVGYDEVVLPALASGVNGMILASANFIPDIWLEMYKAVQEQNLQKAQEIQMNVQKLARITAKSRGNQGGTAAEP